VDRDPEGDKASYGNAGGIAVTEVVPAATPRVLLRVPGWLLDPLGPLAIRPTHAISLIPWLLRFGRSSERGEFERISRVLATLNARIYDDLIPMLRVTGLLSDLHQQGALSVYETEAGYLRDAQEWQWKRAMGVVVQEMTGNEARLLEPSLGPVVQRAVLTPQWSHVSDPKRIVQGIFRWLVSRGVTIRAGHVSDIVSSSAGAPCIQLDGGEVLVADKAVNAAGAWSGILARRIGDRVLLESERGYNATLPTPGVEIGRQLIFAERKFVATPLSCGLRIGGAAEFGGLEAAPNFKRSQTLVASAQRYLPKLDTQGATNWAGHRPATPDGLPVIGYSTARPNVIHAFGHGHLGLTQAATTGRLVAELAFQRPATIDLEPFAISRFG
jgi:D-amino-acid dehydrogenase